MPFICSHHFLVEATSGFGKGILATVAVSVVSFILILIFVIIIVAQCRWIIMKRKAPTIMASRSSAKAAEADVCSNEAYGMTKIAEEGIYEKVHDV